LQQRKVTPVQQSSSQQQVILPAPKEQQEQGQNYSKVVAADAEFRLLIGDALDGMLARFVQDKLRLMFWHRERMANQTVFGAQLDLAVVEAGLKERVKGFEPAYREGICIAILDDKARPVALSLAGL